MTLGARIARIRDKTLKLNQTDFATLMGVSGASTISNWENDIREPGISYLVKVAELGEVSLDWLLTGEHKDVTNFVKEQGITYVPIDEALINGKIHYPELQIMGQVPAGKADIKYSVDDDYFKFELDPRIYFVLRVDEEYGFSMQPFLKPGDFVICHINNKNIKSGDLVVVRYDGTKGAIKKYVYNPDVKDVVVLESINKSEDPIILNQSQIIDKYKIQAFWKK